MDLDKAKAMPQRHTPIRANRYSFSSYEILCGIIGKLEPIFPFMSYHHLKTAILAESLVWELSLRQKEREFVLQLALLHDIGFFTRNRMWRTFETDRFYPKADLPHPQKSGKEGGKKKRRPASEGDELGFIQKILTWPNRIEPAYWGYRLLQNCPDCEEIARLVLYRAFPYKYLHLMKLNAQKQRLISLVQVADLLAFFLSRKDMKMTSNLDDAHRNLRKDAASGDLDPELADFALSALSRRRDLVFDMKHPDSWAFEFEPKLKSLGELTPEGLHTLFRAMSHFVDAKSPYTYQHTETVTKTAQAIARHMKLPQNAITKLTLAALMHDLGKLSTPTSILHKAGPLTDAETFKMQEHVYMTYLFFKNFVELKEVLFVAATHHERLDGSGYPWGLKGPDLPLLSRILQVADVYAAMREDRPYRNGVAHDVAMRVLIDYARSGRLDPLPISFLEECEEELYDPPSLSSKSKHVEG